MADHMRTELVLDAGAWLSPPERRPWCDRADRGSQYTSNDHLDYYQTHQLRPSVGRVATCFDNAVAESFWASLKRECIRGGVFATQAEARRAIFKWINWHNTRRLLSSLDPTPPATWEQQYRQASWPPSAQRGDAQSSFRTLMNGSDRSSNQMRSIAAAQRSRPPPPSDEGQQERVDRLREIVDYDRKLARYRALSIVTETSWPLRNGSSKPNDARTPRRRSSPTNAPAANPAPTRSSSSWPILTTSSTSSERLSRNRRPKLTVNSASHCGTTTVRTP